MKKFSKKRKEFIMAAAIVLSMLLPMTTNAQTKIDGFFANSCNDYNDRDVSVSGNFLNASNQTFGTTEAPLGSGLLILVATGAVYALLKKKED